MHGERTSPSGRTNAQRLCRNGAARREERIRTSRTVDRRLVEPEKTRSADFSRILGEAG